MESNLAGRKVIVTGAGDGIGRELALAFGRAGARVAGCARNAERLELLSREMDGDGHFFSSADMTRNDDIQNFHDRAIEALGGLDVLVNNVGSIVKLCDFFELSDEDWQASFDVNFLSAVRMIRACVGALRHSGAPRIVNISSVAAMKPGPVFPQYSAMKAALSNLTVSLAQSLAADKILVNSVSPGPVWSKSWENEAKSFAEQAGIKISEAEEKIKSDTAETLPLKQMGTPADVCGLVLYLASDQAKWITGSNFTVDGGATLDPF